jgi:uncharacterized protein (DUF4415 family)
MTASKRNMPTLPATRPPLTDEDGEVRELEAEDFEHFRPMTEVFPEIVEAFERSRGQRGPQKSEVKHRIGLRLDQNIVEHFRATGPGWQSRINDILAEHVKKHS